MVPVIDEGNTLTKIYFIENNQVAWGAFFRDKSKAIEFISKIIPRGNLIIYISVVQESEVLKFIGNNYEVFIVSTDLASEIINKYETPGTLGVDRWCAVNGAYFISKKVPLLVIDFGTAITMDFVNENKEYLGGSIAPGIELRFKALNKFTSKLPYIPFNNNKPPLIGTSTASSISGGVINGTISEYKCLIEEYKIKFPAIRIFFTGGNSSFFELHLKNANFVNSFLVPLGGYAVYLYNTNNK